MKQCLQSLIFILFPPKNCEKSHCFCRASVARPREVYCIPLKGESILQISCATGEQRLLLPDNGSMEGNNKWESAVMTADGGAIYCMPLVCKRVLKIRTGPGKRSRAAVPATLFVALVAVVCLGRALRR